MRTRWERIKNTVSTFFFPEMDPKEIVEAQQEVNLAVEEVVLPKKSDWEDNSAAVAELNLDELAEHPVFEEVSYLFEDVEKLPSFAELKRHATDAANRTARGLNAKSVPFEEHQVEDKIWPVFRKLQQSAKDTKRGKPNAVAKIKQAKKAYLRLQSEYEALLDAHRLAAFEAAAEWIDASDDTVDELQRTRRKLRKTARVERLAAGNRAMRAGRSTTRHDADELMDKVSALVDAFSGADGRKKATARALKLVNEFQNGSRLTDEDDDEDEAAEG